MPILDERVEGYLQGLRPERSPVMAEMEAVIEGDARETLDTVSGPIDLLFVDAAKEQYAEYIETAESKLSKRAVLVVDNSLMSGEVALPADAETFWRGEALASARRLNANLIACERWLACVLPVGDGIAFGTRR